MLLPTRITSALLLDLSAQEFGITIEYRADLGAQRAPKRTLRSGKPHTPDQLWDYLHQVLELEGLTTVIGSREGSVYRVVPIQEAFDRAAVTERPVHPAPGYTVRRYETRGLPHEEIREGISRFRPELGQSIASMPDGRAVLIGAVTHRHDEILRYIDASSSLARSVRTEFVPVRHLEHGALIDQIRSQTDRVGGVSVPSGHIAPGPRPGLIAVTAPARDQGAWRNLIERFDLPPGVETVSHPLVGFAVDEAIDLIDQVARDPSTRGSGDRWSVVHNEPAGTLIFTATRAEQSRVEGLLDQLAAIPPEHRIQTRSFTITNRDAVGLQASLFGLLGIDSPDVSSPDASDGSESGAARQTGAGSASRRDGLVLAVDDQLNTIIASGSPALLDRVAELIERLDIRQPQVLLEIILVSLSEGQSKDLGVEIQAQIGDSGTLFGLGSIFGLSNVGPGSGTPDAGGNGGSLVILDPGDFSVVVRALDTISDGRAVSTARTLVMNNESANISNTVSEPYADVVFDDGDAITGFGGSESAGTNISVTPQIAQGEFLVLDYDVSLSAFLGESTPGLPPSEQSTSISSTATIPDGHCVVVGGLELLNQSDTTTKTPMLAELPVLGGLFRNSSRSDSRTRFFLFIRASIMRERGFERLRHLSERRAADAEIDAGWPVVKPVLIR